MRFAAILIATGIGLTGCSGIPKSMQNPATPVSVDELVLAVECEYFSIYQLDDAASGVLGDWVAGTDYDLKVTDGMVFKPGLTIAPPAGTVTVVLAGSTSADDEAIRQQKFRLFTDLGSIAPDTDRGKVLDEKCPRFNGSIGSRGLQIGAQLRGLASGMVAAGIPAAALAVPTQKLTFTVDRTIGSGLTFKAGDATLKAESSSANRKMENVITIALQRHSAPSDQKGDQKGVFGGPAEDGDTVYEDLNNALDKLREDENELVLKPGDSLVVDQS